MIMRLQLHTIMTFVPDHVLWTTDSITLINNYVSTATYNYYFDLKGSFRTARNYGFTGGFAFKAKPIDLMISWYTHTVRNKGNCDS